jgi:hypothetical protein
LMTFITPQVRLNPTPKRAKIPPMRRPLTIDWMITAALNIAVKRLTVEAQVKNEIKKTLNARWHPD